MPASETHFLVNPYNDPVMVRVVGKATFHNSAPLRDFFERMVRCGKHQYIIDFHQCDGMDSTFLGIIAGLGIEMLRSRPPGSIVLARLGSRNLDLVRNLGLDRIMAVDDGLPPAAATAAAAAAAPLAADSDRRSAIEGARLVLESHENLARIDAANETRFQDVLAFLRNQVAGDQ
jgi:anti-anti-sigma regulatory factor